MTNIHKLRDEMATAYSAPFKRNDAGTNSNTGGNRHRGYIDGFNACEKIYSELVEKLKTAIELHWNCMCQPDDNEKCMQCLALTEYDKFKGSE